VTVIGKLAHANSDQFSPFQNDEKTLKRTVKKDPTVNSTKSCINPRPPCIYLWATLS